MGSTTSLKQGHDNLKEYLNDKFNKVLEAKKSYYISHPNLIPTPEEMELHNCIDEFSKILENVEREEVENYIALKYPSFEGFKKFLSSYGFDILFILLIISIVYFLFSVK